MAAAWGPDPLQEHPYYESVQVLGQGSSGATFLALNTASREPAVIKAVPIAQATWRLQEEVESHSRLRHPHVIRLKEVFLAPGTLCVAAEYADGGSLLQLLQREGRLAEPLARLFFQQLVVAVDYCHRAGAAGLGLTLRHTMLQALSELAAPVVKIRPYSATHAGAAAAHEPAPRGGAERGAGAQEGADVWACGVILYAMVCGGYPPQPPPGAAPPRGPAYPPGLRLSDGCRELIGRMLAPDPAQRIEIREILAHPWFGEDLPAAALEMNDRYVAAAPVPAPGREPQEIQALFRLAAAAAPGDPPAPAPADEDEDEGSGSGGSGPYSPRRVAYCWGALILSLKLCFAAARQRGARGAGAPADA